MNKITKKATTYFYTVLVCVVFIGCNFLNKKYDYGLTYSQVKNDSRIYEERQIAFLQAQLMWSKAIDGLSKNYEKFYKYNDSSDYYLAKEKYLRTLESDYLPHNAH